MRGYDGDSMDDEPTPSERERFWVELEQQQEADGERDALLALGQAAIEQEAAGWAEGSDDPDSLGYRG